MKKYSEIIAHSLIAANVNTLTFVPGYGASNVFDDYGHINEKEGVVSFHPEVAYGIAHGSSLTGKRAAILVKTHGFFKAANAIYDSMYSGINGGLVIFIFEDKEGMAGSILDMSPVLTAMKIPFFVLSPTGKNAFHYILQGFDFSEKFGLPYVIVVEAGYMENLIDEDIHIKETNPVIDADTPFSFKRDIRHHVLCPLFTKFQRKVLGARLENKPQSIEDIEWVDIPEIPEGLPARWHHVVRQYEPIFKVLKAYRGPIVTGDVGVSSFFAFPPYNCVDVTTYMGGSLALGIGACLAGCNNVWVVTGDFAFISAGHLGLIEAVQRNLALKVIVLCNGKSETTGGLPIPIDFPVRIVDGYKEFVRNIRDPLDTNYVRAVMEEASRAHELRIILVDFRDKKEISYKH